MGMLLRDSLYEETTVFSHMHMYIQSRFTLSLKVPSDGSRAIAHLPISLYYRVLSV